MTNVCILYPYGLSYLYHVLCVFLAVVKPATFPLWAIILISCVVCFCSCCRHGHIHPLVYHTDIVSCVFLAVVKPATFPLWAIILIILIVVLLFLIICCICCCLWCQRNKGDEYPGQYPNKYTNKYPDQYPTWNHYTDKNCIKHTDKYICQYLLQISTDKYKGQYPTSNEISIQTSTQISNSIFFTSCWHILKVYW